MMDGTTLCPHCDTRFKVTEEQLNAHHGMVRCGHCLHVFDAHLSFVPAPPSPQLELPMPAFPEVTAPEVPPAPEPVEPVEPVEPAEPAGAAVILEPIETGATESPVPADGAYPEHAEAVTEVKKETQESTATPPKPQPMTLAAQVVIVEDESENEPGQAHRSWPWAIAATLFFLLLLAQAAYFFRTDLAALHPELKPALTEYCKLLGCDIPLPRKIDQISIESSSLEADPAHEDRIVLNVLIRNRADFVQAYPHLELTLNDTHDLPLARRAFRPADYLQPTDSESAGLPGGQELIAKLLLDTSDLRPSGYRLVLFYP